MKVLLHPNLPGFKNLGSGKVRENILLSDNTRGMITTDRISALDKRIEGGVPGRGIALNLTSAWWFDYFGSRGVQHHMLGTQLPPELAHRHDLKYRFMKCVQGFTLPVEAIARDYMSPGNSETSLLRHYRQGTNPYGLPPLPLGLLVCSKLPFTAFTPTTKGEAGSHDIPITFDQMIAIIADWGVGKGFWKEAEKMARGGSIAEVVRDKTLTMYKEANAHTMKVGIITADTKIEWAIYFLPDGTMVIMVCDELFTGDSSRQWLIDDVVVGQDPKSLDKEPIRAHLRQEEKAGRWDGKNRIRLPNDIVTETLERYIMGYEKVTGREFPRA